MTSPSEHMQYIEPTGRVKSLLDGINAQASNGSGWLLGSEEAQLLIAEYQRITALARQAEALQRRAESAEALAERLKLEAQAHAMEARTANSTINEIYQVVSGGKGERGNWHGAVPVRERLEALQRENAEKDVQIERLEADLEEARDVPWPDWARTILKTLQQYGYDPVIDGEVDLGEAFKDYLEGVSQSEKEQVARTREALRPFARLSTEFSHEPDDWKIWGLNNAELTYGDFRRARALLGGSENAE